MTFEKGRENGKAKMTYNHAKDHIITRKVDLIKVVGKTKPVQKVASSKGLEWSP
jgi:hypothetical protein